MAAFAPLNWKEIAQLARLLDARVRGSFVDRVIVPERSRFPDGFLKSEWAIRLSRGGCLLASARPRAPYATFVPGKGPAAAAKATQSAFGLALAKHLPGAKIVALRALERERAIELELAGELSLLLVMIPATPEGVLLERGRVIARSRNLPLEAFTRPDGSRAPADLPCREISLEGLNAQLAAALDFEALALRVARIEKLVRESRKRFTERARQSEEAADQAAREADWSRYGELLKSTLPEAPPLRDGKRALLDYATGQTIEVPGDAKLDAAAQVAKYFSLAKRRAKRASEAASRIAVAREELARLEQVQAELLEGWPGVERAEARLGIGAVIEDAGPKGRASDWPGRKFLSRDGWAIWVGRDKEENLELTFKRARGNDVWMHVRGKPGAHIVIPVQPGKSVPLETLLDAAHLCIQYSGGESWGTTEVDYTFKKHVKRIRDSTEASYTGNKSLLVKPDPARIKRLLG